MRHSLFLAVLVVVVSTKGLSNDFFSQADTFLKVHVNNGRVAYADIKAKPQQLDALVSQIMSFELVKMNKTTKVAFMINAYNILAIKGIIDEYPVKSPMSINNFFDKQIYNVGGKIMSLNQLEKEELYPLAEDPRLHFVLVCAAISCPKLANFAYVPSKLGEQIEATTRKNLNDPDFIKVDKNKFRLSEIFNWYSADFNSKEQNVIDFINRYREIKMDTKMGVRFYSYNWDLNDQK
jgi:Protein of unknown function, DUF547